MTLRVNSKRRLRVGLLLDSLTQPKWVFNIIKELQGSSFAEICLIIKNETIVQPQSRLSKYWQNRKYLLYAFYNRVDAHARIQNDALQEINLHEIVAKVPVIGVQPVMKKYSDWFPEEAIEKIRAFDLDVALSFGFRILRGEALRISRHGVWSYHHGDNRLNRGGPAGFWEVMEGTPTAGAVLQVLSEDLDNGEVLDRTSVRTADRFSVRGTRNNLFWRSSSFVMRKLKELYDTGNVTTEENRFRPYYNRLHRMPSNSEILPQLVKLSLTYAAAKIEQALFLEQWTLAYRFRSSRTDPNNSFYRFIHLTPPKDRYWADPFPALFDGKYFVFFEEYLLKDRRAHISVMELTKSGASSPVPVLIRNYHLSYPFVFHWNNRYLMIPETGAKRRIELYACESFPDRWELETVLFEDVAARDATLVEVDGIWWMFVSIADTDSSDELHVYYSSTPFGPWKPHQKNPIKSDVRNSRPAGRLFYWNGDLYRPAQDSSNGYGYGMTINKILRLTPNEFAEQEVSKVLPRWRKNLRGTHTLNICEDLTVIDCLVRRKA
jgi:hypothetical protein